jgi:hypothetical protein
MNITPCLSNFQKLLVLVAFLVGIAAPTIASAVTPMVSAGFDFSVALKSDGTLATWGDNTHGQLGDGSRTNRLIPATVPGLSGVVAVKAGHGYVVALKSDGTVVAWGYNAFRTLGDGTQTDRLTPVVVPGLAGAVAVAAGATHTLALNSDGTVMAWGNDTFGQLGRGTWGFWSSSPAAVTGLTGVVAVAAGLQHSVALKSDGMVLAWGFNGYGQLGTGDTTQRSSPTVVPGLNGVVSVVAGDDYSMALKSDGTVVKWGSGTTYPVPVPGLTQVASLSALSASRLLFAAAVKSDGTVWELDWATPRIMSGLAGVVSVSSGANHAVALKSDGTLSAWGWNDVGQLGDGTTASSFNPVAVSGGSMGAATLAVSFSPASLTFPAQDIGSSSPAQSLTLTNSGSSPLYFPGIVSSKDYSRTTTCGTILAIGENCTVSVTFNPTQTGVRGGSLTVIGNGANLHSVSLIGTGLALAQTIGAINFSPIALFVGTTTTASAAATSGLAVSFTSTTPGICTVSGSIVTGIAAGTCSIVAGQAGDANYLAANQVMQSVIIKTSQTIGAISFSSALAVGGSATASATSSSGLAVSFSSATSSVCTVSGSIVTGIAAGTCSIVAGQAGDTSYLAANQVTQSITVSKGSQSIGVISFSNAVTVGAATAASAVATSGLAVTLSSTTPGVCAVSGITIIAIAAGTCTLAANQAGNANFNAAPQVTQSVAVLALDFTRLLPHAAGSQWSYINNNQVTTTTTTGSPVTLPGGVVAIPWTRVDSSQPGYTVTYNTFDANGWRRHQEYMSSVYVSGYGYTTATVVYTPAVILVPANAAIGNTYAATGVVTITYANVTTVTLDYSGTTQIVGFETVSNSAGTQSWPALKGIISTTLSGMINGAPLTTTSSSTAWLADGLGVVQNYTPNASGTMETWKLTSTNVVTPVTIGSATAGNSSATVSFYAPASNGGSTLTGYTVTSAPGGITASGTASPIIVTGLTNGTTYTFTVKANYNTVGGASSAPSNSVTPAGPAVSLSAPSLTFLGWPQATSSSAQTITLTNSGNASLTISSITVSGNFARSTNCGTTLGAGANCAVSVTFTPTTTGVRSGTLSIASNASGSPHDVSLGGTGTPAVLDVPLTLRQGWNLLGNSLNQTLSVATLFGDANVVSTVWKWEPGANRWLFFTPMLDATALQTYANSKGYGVLSQIGPGEGYWVNAKIAAELAAQTGSVFVLTAAHLAPGWNLVATGQEITPATFNRSLSETPPSPGVVPQNLTSLWAWDNPANGWYFYAPSLEAQGGTVLTDYIASKGYRHFSQHNKMLGNGAGFWVNRPQQ